MNTSSLSSTQSLKLAHEAILGIEEKNMMQIGIFVCLHQHYQMFPLSATNKERNRHNIYEYFCRKNTQSKSSYASIA